VVGGGGGGQGVCLCRRLDISGATRPEHAERRQRGKGG